MAYSKGFTILALALVIGSLALVGVIYQNVNKPLGATPVTRYWQGGTGTSTAPSEGDLLMGDTNSNYGPSELIAGTNVTIATTSVSDGRGSITISASVDSGDPFSWTPYADGVSTSTLLRFDSGFISQASSTISATLYGNDSIFSSYIDASHFVATSTTATSTFLGGVHFNGDTGLFWEPNDERLSIGDKDNSLTINGATSLGSKFLTHTQGVIDVFDIISHSHNDTALFGTAMGLVRSRGDETTPTIVQNNDTISRIVSYGYDGTDYAELARIDVFVDGTPSDGTDMPGRIVLSTTPDGAGVAVNRLTILSGGNVGIGTTSPYRTLSVAGSGVFTGGDVLASTFTATSSFVGTLTGNADTATNLASNGANCSAGNAPLGVDTAGAVESCFDVWTEAENTSAGYTSNTGTVTSIATTYPISGGTITTTGTLSLSDMATTSLTATSPLSLSQPISVIGTSASALSISTAGDWTGTFDGQEGTYYLNASNLTNFGTPFWTFFNATTTDALTQGSTNLYSTQANWDTFWNASTTLNSVTSIPNLATIGTITSGTWSGGTIAVNKGGTGLTSYTLGDVIYASGTGTLAGTTTANLKTTLALNLVENTALTTWAGSANLTTLGTITSGTWSGTAIDESKLDTDVIVTTEIDTYSEINAIVADVTLTHNGLIDTSAEVAGIVTDETGSGAMCFATNPTLTGAVLNGVIDAGGATSFEIPNGANPTVDTLGEIALDTTDGQLLVATSTTVAVIRTDESIFGFTLASTSPEFFSGGSLPVPPEKDGYIVTSYSCYVTAGTSVVLTPSDGSNDMDAITCATTLTTDTSISANNTVTAGELMQIKVGTITGTVDYVSMFVFGTYTRE